MNCKKNILFVAFIFVQAVFAQQARVSAKLDTTAIKIGEQVGYQLQVEADTLAQVVFPKEQSFYPLEVLDSQQIDTFRSQEKIRLVKHYYLTQFDSGRYVIPAQKVLVSGKNFPVDTLHLRVFDVPVDTLKQNLFPIKPILPAKSPPTSWGKILLFCALGLLLIFGAYWLFFRKKKLTEEEKIRLLSPFDRAILGLKNLQKSKFLMESKHKEYYSELTDIIRNYLEEEVHISATESTTDELLAKIQTLLDAGRLHLNQETISDLSKVLRKADLVKFARSRPEDFEAENDRNVVQNIVVKTREALPEPLLDEVQNSDNQYRSGKLKKIIIGSVVGLWIVFLAGGVWLLYQKIYHKVGIEKMLKTEDWVTSVYGFPPVKMASPDVFQRVLLPKNATDTDSFAMEKEDFSAWIDFQKLPRIQGENPEQQLIERIEMLAQQSLQDKLHGSNVLTQQEEYKTASGVGGIKVFGTLDKPVSVGNPQKYNYQQYIFFSPKGYLIVLLFAYENQQKDQGAELVEKIMSSFDLQR